MKLTIYSRPFQLTAGMENYIREKLGKALTKAPNMTAVSVTVSDINGPRGGEDKECKLQFSLAGLGQFVIKDTKSDLYRAIDSASARARHAVSRAINRRQKRVKLRNRSEYRSIIGDDDDLESARVPATA